MPEGEVCPDCEEQQKIAKQAEAINLPPIGVAGAAEEQVEEVKNVVLPEEVNRG